MTRLQVSLLPSVDLLCLNLVFVSSRRFRDDQYVKVGNFVYSVAVNQDIRENHIALSDIQRKQSEVTEGESVYVTEFYPPQNFDLSFLHLTLEFKVKGSKVEFDAALLKEQFQKVFNNQVLTTEQEAYFKYEDTIFVLRVKRAVVMQKNSVRGIVSPDTIIVFQNSSAIKIINQSEAERSIVSFYDGCSVEPLGLGGLRCEYNDIFRRVILPRLIHPQDNSKFWHVKGMLLYGPPGTGKSSLALFIGKLLAGRDPKIINGSELLRKFVGESEKSIRDLFADAENERRTHGDQSGLHVIIIDEIDAICKSRGSTRDGSGEHDSFVNKLLAKMDSMNSFNNVLLIGTTNRKDFLDDALLRPGRMEIQVELSLPNKRGRLEILNIHIKKLMGNLVSGNLDVLDLAAKTDNYSGAELEAVVKSAVSFALKRQYDHTMSVDVRSITLTMEDFFLALSDIVPAFRRSMNKLELSRLYNTVDWGIDKDIYKTAILLVEQAQKTKVSQLVSCLLEGPSGSGKSTIAANLGLCKKFTFSKTISAEKMIGLSESSKCAQIVKVFEDAYKSQLSIVILDDVERLLEYNAIGQTFSNLIFQTLMALLKKFPLKGMHMLVIGTTSKVEFLKSCGFYDAFDVICPLRTLDIAGTTKVLNSLEYFAENDVAAAAMALTDMPIKKVLLSIEMAIQHERKDLTDNIRLGSVKMDLERFLIFLDGIKGRLLSQN